ncbi:hypothetical protein N7448_004818 [Penicillium atrosanguineum]|uniref:uncharacterized protein n=1 Tax=Penicillium atrosanguineum TaxID=1132637 RepID=UPI00239B38B8|nr:uncharacterized protein N7443_008568 [Penicillium atrosanguineum]KAJ5125498.1 hypothetical protein N7526_007675 [Penicillium atrosanguineum]KAJ5136264.1 hypothetical protein N7448_004818 [Penicillium atrosanguineum]KAJ5292615.1 hypothetical protein N7443_008568 [Penicillium atrosanguineum]
MAAPATTTIKNLTGQWQMDTTLSDPTDSILSLQGMSWFLRKALPYATVTLHVKEYAEEANPLVYHIDVDQVITGGINGTQERRQLDWEQRDHTDNIFGTLHGRSRFIRGVKGADGKVRPAVEIQTKVGDAAADEKAGKFLRGEILADGSASEGYLVEDEGDEFGEGEGLYVQSWVVNEESGWTAEQIWGFELINGSLRHHSRRVAVTKGNGHVELARLVYVWQKPTASE